LLLVGFPNLAQSPSLGSFIGLNLAEAGCFLLFWAINMWIVVRGLDSIKWLEYWSAPFLLLIGIGLLIWAWIKVGSIGRILEASYQLQQSGELQKDVRFWSIFLPNLTAMVGFWATLSLNIPDFTRYAKSQKEQILGQLYGLPTTMAFYSFISIAVTSATLLVFGEAIWDPVKLLARFPSPWVVVISMIGLTIATLSTNIAANVVAPANAFANVSPRRISFRMGGMITGLIGILMFPWKLVADPNGYIFTWLIAYSALLGAIAGIMICDYYLVRRKQIDVAILFDPQGAHRGWNVPAWIAFVVSCLPVLPGFLVQVGLLSLSKPPVPDAAGLNWLALSHQLYTYAWFVTFFIAFLVYAILKRRPVS
jgi:NCS1 family nucleobase:cation symporter-1